MPASQRSAKLKSLSAFGGAGLIFPEPREVQWTDAGFAFDGAAIVLPANPSPNDLALARFLANELSDRWDVQLPLRHVDRLPAGRSILIGAITNPLVREYCAKHHIEMTAATPGLKATCCAWSRS